MQKKTINKELEAAIKAWPKVSPILTAVVTPEEFEVLCHRLVDVTKRAELKKNKHLKSLVYALTLSMSHYLIESSLVMSRPGPWQRAQRKKSR